MSNGTSFAGNIKKIEKFSLCDWGSMVSAAIFLGGCNFRCPTCHNWELATRPNNITSISPDSVISYLRRSFRWLDGVVITGGEPTVHKDLSVLVSKIENMGLKVNLHTNGSRPDLIRYYVEQGLVDVFSVDVKGPFAKYPLLTGGRMSMAGAQESLGAIFELARQHPEKFYFRTTLVPFLDEEDLAVCQSYMPEGQTLHFQDYREPTDPEQLELLK